MGRDADPSCSLIAVQTGVNQRGTNRMGLSHRLAQMEADLCFLSGPFLHLSLRGQAEGFVIGESTQTKHLQTCFNNRQGFAAGCRVRAL